MTPHTSARPLRAPAVLSRRERRRAETRERIFRAALKRFAQRGFVATTVEDITDAADVGKGTFFNYFPSKEHVLAAFSEMQLAKLQAALSSGPTAERPLPAVLHGMVHALAD
jgi:AcrR family transcriptional regulator